MSHQITLRECREIQMVLREWGSRTLPELTSDLRIAALQRRIFRGPTEDIMRAQEKIVREIEAPADVEMAKIPPAIAEARANRMNIEVLDKTLEVPDIPETLVLTEKDLPKTIKTGLAEENRAGLGNLLAVLPDWLFELEHKELTEQVKMPELPTNREVKANADIQA